MGKGSYGQGRAGTRGLLTRFLDTSVLIRYLTGDISELARRATGIIDGEDDLWLTDVVLAETAHVLTSVYHVNRDVVVDQLIAFIQRQNISIYALQKALVIQALLMCRPSGRVSFGDALIWAAARTARADAIYSLDERFPEDGLEVLRGPAGP